MIAHITNLTSLTSSVLLGIVTQMLRRVVIARRVLLISNIGTFIDVTGKETLLLQSLLIDAT
jgi:hypothetical protein